MIRIPIEALEEVNGYVTLVEIGGEWYVYKPVE
jgi:hypothetical protein